MSEEWYGEELDRAGPLNIGVWQKAFDAKTTTKLTLDFILYRERKMRRYPQIEIEGFLRLNYGGRTGVAPAGGVDATHLSHTTVYLV